MPTYPLPTLACTISAAGISAPSYSDILQSLQASFQAIYGADAYIAPDSQDGQLLAVFASAINDANAMAISVYNAFSPTFALGTGLDRVVKINGIRRNVSTYSTAVGNVVGVAGTVIAGGVVADVNGNLWNLPASVTIPGGGLITVTVTSQTPGAIVAPSGTINSIQTPTFGWQSFTSTADAAPGQPVETDAELRQRQAASTSLPAQTPVGSIYAALANLTGVTALRVYENPTASTDSDGIPEHSICAVVEGGDTSEIAAAIGSKKTPGANTYGTTSDTYTDPVSGIVYTIHWFVPTQKTIKVNLTIHALTGYSSPVADEIKASLVAYINTLGIGDDVLYTRLFPPAYLNGAPDSRTFEVTAMTIAIGVGVPGTSDLTIAFNETAVSTTADIAITVI